LILEIIAEFQEYLKAADINSDTFEKSIEEFQKEILELVS